MASLIALLTVCGTAATKIHTTSHRRRGAPQASSTNSTSNITYFATLFDSSDHAWKSKELISQTARLSLASAPNLGRLTILTHATYRGLAALRDLASPAVGVEVLPDHDVGLVTHPNNWVLRVELFKYQFARRQAPGTRLVYVELDQLFLPGAGTAFAAVFERPFDVAFTFNKEPDRFGSVNTGVILIRAGPRALKLLDEAAKRTLQSTGSRSSGGENQKALTHLMPHLAWGETWTGEAWTILSLQYPGPLNYHAKGCCHLKPDVVVAHFKSMKKRWAKDRCCRDRVAADNGRAWKSACKCVQDDVKKLPECSPDNASVLSDSTGWCESY